MYEIPQHLSFVVVLPYTNFCWLMYTSHYISTYISNITVCVAGADLMAWMMKNLKIEDQSKFCFTKCIITLTPKVEECEGNAFGSVCLSVCLFVCVPTCERTRLIFSQEVLYAFLGPPLR